MRCLYASPVYTFRVSCDCYTIKFLLADCLVNAEDKYSDPSSSYEPLYVWLIRQSCGPNIFQHRPCNRLISTHFGANHSALPSHSPNG